MSKLCRKKVHILVNGATKCAECKRLRKQRWKDRYPEKVKAWREKNKDKDKIWSKSWGLKNPETCKIKDKIWKEANRDKVRSASAKNRAKRISRVPKWLTPEHKKEIAQIYKKAKDMEKETGIGYHVDHIVPLIGKNVCGLHVPWNLQILEASENYRKSNK